MRALSPLISTVLLIAIVFGIAAVISPWLFNLTDEVTTDTGTRIRSQITCQSTSYDFDTSYATFGVNATISDTEDSIQVKIVNTGTINLHTFSLEIEIASPDGFQLLQFGINETSQKTKALPLKPGQSALLKANLTQDLNGTLESVKVLNIVCPTVFVSQDL